LSIQLVSAPFGGYFYRLTIAIALLILVVSDGGVGIVRNSQYIEGAFLFWQIPAPDIRVIRIFDGGSAERITLTKIKMQRIACQYQASGDNFVVLNAVASPGEATLAIGFINQGKGDFSCVRVPVIGAPFGRGGPLIFIAVGMGKNVA